MRRGRRQKVARRWNERGQQTSRSVGGHTREQGRAGWIAMGEDTVSIAQIRRARGSRDAEGSADQNHVDEW